MGTAMKYLPAKTKLRHKQVVLSLWFSGDHAFADFTEEP
jgi:hypothetical protein